MTQYSVEQLIGQLDRCSPKKRFVKLKGIKGEIKVNNSHNRCFFRLYTWHKKGVALQCSCCGAKPTHVTYSLQTGLRMVVDDKKNYLNFDHIIPQFVGGSDKDSNLRITCFNCNLAKGCKLDTQTASHLSNLQKRYNLVEVYKVLKRAFRKRKEEIQRVINRMIDILGKKVVDEVTFTTKVLKHLKEIVSTIEVDKIPYEVVL